MKHPTAKALFLAVTAAIFSGGALAQSPYTEPDRTMITINGTVDKIYNDAFTLDYGDGFITVEMDDGDRDADAYVLRHGDEVTVTGRVDADFYESTSIEAGSVYVKNLDTFFYASSLDEEGDFMPLYYPDDMSMETLVGVVTSVADDEFTLATGNQKVTVEVDDLAYDPLDNSGYPQIDKFDVVSIRGHVDPAFFEEHTFEADGITTILDAGG